MADLETIRRLHWLESLVGLDEIPHFQGMWSCPLPDYLNGLTLIWPAKERPKGSKPLQSPGKRTKLSEFDPRTLALIEAIFRSSKGVYRALTLLSDQLDTPSEVLTGIHESIHVEGYGDFGKDLVSEEKVAKRVSKALGVQFFGADVVQGIRRRTRERVSTLDTPGLLEAAKRLQAAPGENTQFLGLLIEGQIAIRSKPKSKPRSVDEGVHDIAKAITDIHIARRAKRIRFRT